MTEDFLSSANLRKTSPKHVSRLFYISKRRGHDVENEPKHGKTGGLDHYSLSNPPKTIDQNSILTRNLEPDQILKSLTFSSPWSCRPFFKFSCNLAQLKYMIQRPWAACDDESDLDHPNTWLTSLLHLIDSPLNHLRSFLTKLCRLEEKPLIPRGTCKSKFHCHKYHEKGIKRTEWMTDSESTYSSYWYLPRLEYKMALIPITIQVWFGCFSDFNICTVSSQIL